MTFLFRLFNVFVMPFLLFQMTGGLRVHWPWVIGLLALGFGLGRI